MVSTVVGLGADDAGLRSLLDGSRLALGGAWSPGGSLGSARGRARGGSAAAVVNMGNRGRVVVAVGSGRRVMMRTGRGGSSAVGSSASRLNKAASPGGLNTDVLLSRHSSCESGNGNNAESHLDS